MTQPVSQNQLQEMLQTAKEHWDFQSADEPYSEMEPQIDGMIGADLSDDQEMIDEYVSDENDWDGLSDYILATMGRL